MGPSGGGAHPEGRRPPGERIPAGELGTDRAGKEDFGMSRSDVIAWLQEHPGWHRTVVIKRGVGKSPSSVRASLTALAKHGEIKMRLLGDGPKARLEWLA